MTSIKEWIQKWFGPPVPEEEMISIEELEAMLSANDDEWENEK